MDSSSSPQSDPDDSVQLTLGEASRRSKTCRRESTGQESVSETAEPSLRSEFEPGDTIEVSVRKTKMEIEDVRPSDYVDVRCEVVAANQYGRYLIRETVNRGLSFYAESEDFLGATWSFQAGGVDVDGPH
jgi:hypothetical protein